MKFLMIKLPVLALLSSFMASPTWAAYETKSRFKTDYKCISDVQGGYNHKKDGHKLTGFSKTEEFFLTHVSNVPITAANEYLTTFKGFTADNLTVDLSRQFFESFIMKVDDYSNDDSVIIYEKNSYFIRKPEEDPNDLSIYVYSLLGSCDATFMKLKTGETKSMQCSSDDASRSFLFNINNGKFTYTYSGDWHQEQQIPDYYGDSAIIAMGMCKPYYR